MTVHVNGGDELYEDKFARVYAEIVRIDQLRSTDAEAREKLAIETHRRLDQRMDAQETAVAAALAAAEKAVTAALTAADKAVSKAEVAQSKVNETQNEFRGTLRDQASQFIPRSETENLIRELRGLIANQASEIAGLRSRIDVGPPSLSTLQSRSDEGIGRREAGASTREMVLGVIAAVGLLAAVVFGIIAAIN